MLKITRRDHTFSPKCLTGTSWKCWLVLHQKALISRVLEIMLIGENHRPLLVKIQTRRITLDIGRQIFERKDIWIDIISDTGDGFNSTFAVANTFAQKTLQLSLETGKLAFVKKITQRSEILIFGGDKVYSFPTQNAYNNKFRIPFQSAGDCTENFENEDDHTEMYAIPGNHD